MPDAIPVARLEKFCRRLKRKAYRAKREEESAGPFNADYAIRMWAERRVLLECLSDLRAIINEELEARGLPKAK